MRVVIMRFNDAFQYLCTLGRMIATFVDNHYNIYIFAANQQCFLSPKYADKLIIALVCQQGKYERVSLQFLIEIDRLHERSI